MGLKDLDLFVQQESQHSEASSAVGRSLSQGLDQNPDEYAELLKLSAKTGIAPTLAKDFKPQLQKQERITGLSIDDMVRTNPKTSQFLSNPENASLSHDDVGILKTMEDTVRAIPAGLAQGWDKQRQMFLNYKEVMGTISPSERAELGQLDEVAKQRAKEYSTGLPSWFKAASDVVGMGANSLLDAASKEGAIGMGTGAATGATLGAIGGPAAPVTATAGGAAGAGIGFKAGMTTGMVINTYESSVGEVYDDLKNFKLPDGTKLDPTVARYASVVAGVPNTALETFALGKALKLIPYADKVIGTIGREQMKEILVRPTMRAAMADIGVKYATAVGTETFTEGLQKFVSILAREAAIVATSEGGAPAEPDWYTKTQERSKQAWKPTTLEPVEEVKFREWLSNTQLFNSVKAEIAAERDMRIDRLPDAVVLDALESQRDYDYRGAYKAGITEVISKADGRPHWPSRAQDGAWLKSPTHPTAWKEFFMQQYDKDPDELGLDTQDKALEWARKQERTPRADQRQGRAYDENQLRDDAKAIIDESTEAFKATVVLGGMGGGVKTYQARQDVQRAEGNQAVFEAIGQNTTDSKLYQRYPEKFEQFVEQATKDGPVQNVYIGSEEFSRFFQSQGIDPEQVAAEAGITNYREAMAGGSDLVVPISQFASKIAPTQYLQGLMPDLRLRQGDLSLREAQEELANREARDAEMLANMEAIVAEQQAAGGFSRAVNDIMTDIEGQLLSIGMTNQMARDEAVKLRGVAVLVERDLKDRASRDGRELSDEQVAEAVRGVWDRYGLTVNRQIPDVLTTAPTSDITIDPLLDSLRAGSFPTDTQIFGPSLSEFVRDAGGLVASGETLTADENMERRPFQRKLVQKNGMTLDKALEAAVQAGYFTNQSTGDLTEADFLNALDEDLRGTPVYSVNNTNNNALAMREAMNSLGEYLDSLGIDLNAITNNAGVRRLIENARRDPLLEGVVSELEQLINNVMGQGTQQEQQEVQSLYQFAGTGAANANVYALENAKQMLANKRSPETVRRETGWFMGVDGLWRFEISDDEAKFNDSAVVKPEDIAEEVRAETRIAPDERNAELFKAAYREDSVDYIGAFGRTEEDAFNNLLNRIAKDRSAGAFQIDKAKEGDEHNLADILDHPKLYAAYPDLATLKVTFIAKGDYRGSYSPMKDEIKIALTGDKVQMLSTVLHEIQHAIQEREGFAKGGMPDDIFAELVKAKLDDIANKTAEDIEQWKWANKFKVEQYEEAARVARYGLMYESAQRLIDYANRDKPSGVFRLIRNEMQWIYHNQFDNKNEANELQRAFYAIPKPHKMRERNAFISDMSFRAGRLLLDEIPSQYVEQFKADPRTMKGMLKGLQRESDKKRKELLGLQDLKAASRRAEGVRDAHKYSSPFTIYQALAGEVEARNTQARQLMTEQERVDTSPSQTADVPAEKMVVMFGGMDIQAPMASALADQTEKDGFKAWSNGHPVVPIGEDADFKSGEGVVVEAIHATTGDFDTFDRSKGNIESDLGAGFYATNSTGDAAANYAGMGPDLTNKVEREFERISDAARDGDEGTLQSIRDVLGIDDDQQVFEDEIEQGSRELARRKFMANEGLTMPVFVRFDNPVVIGGEGETFLDYTENYNEETDEYGEPTGALVDLVMAVRELGDEGSFEMDTEAAVDALMQDAMDNGGLKASDAIESLKKALVYAVDYETGDSATNEVVRQAFERVGFDGFIDTTVNKKFGSEKRVGKAMEGMDSSTVHFIAFKPNQMASRIGSTWERGDVGDSILKQGDQTPRGMIQFGQNRKFNITLLEKANESTFTHEVGHFYLEVLGDLATAEGAGESIAKDYATILKFLGAESRADLTLDGKTKGSAEYNAAVEMHEKFARANEAYWMEGKAPSPELQTVFQRFKDFLKLVYKQLEALNVKLNPEVRAVFDRIYATDAEIQAAKEQVNVDPIFLTAEDAGMTEQEFALYRESVAQATESGKESLLMKLMREMQRDRKAWWKEERQKMHAEVTKEVDDQQVYRTFAALVAGQVDEDTPVKLNKQSLIERYGADYVKRLPRSFGRIYTTTGGMDADSAAEMLGYDSGDKLIEALVGMRDRKELIEAETDVRMLQKHGDMLNDGTIADEAKIALHNAERENVLMSELRALRRKQREVKPFVQAERNKQRAERQQARAATDVPPTEAFRRAAQDVIAKTAVRDISPYTYLQAARKAAKQAFAAMAKGDYQLAADAKQKELLNHHLYIEATKAREEADKILTYAKKFEKGTTREKMGKAGASYLEQIDALLDRYEFRRVPLSKLDRRASLLEWINEQEAAGNEPSINPLLINEARQVNYRQVPMSELRAIYDAVRNIEHLARYKNKLMAKQAEIAFDDAIAELVAAAENMTAGKGDKAVGERKPLPLDMSAMTMREKAGDTVTRLDGMLVKMEQIVEWLDNGNINGPWHTYIWNPITEAQTREYDLTRQLTERLATSLEKMPKEQRLAMLDTFEIAGMGKVTRKFLISIALNMGNQGNIDKLMRGMGWNMGTIEGALTKLNDADWTFVQETWDTINSVWPEIAELEKRMTGLEPPKVEAQPYQVRDENGNPTRLLAGGYYPLVYDPRKSEQGAKQEGGNLGQLFEEGYVRATTPKGHTQARMEGFAAPFLLDFEQVVTQHMAKVVKDLTHREAVVQANKILTNPEIRNALQETMGPAYEKQFLPWLRSVVNDRNGGSVQGLSDFSRWMMSARANVVAATMGFKATTMISQITGISQSLDKVKGRYLGQALLEYMRHPVALTRQVRELSGEMRNRSNTLDRDIRDQLRNLTGQNSKWAQAQRFAFHGIAIADAMVTVPTWMGAYRQALDQGADEPTARLEADAAVRMTQGAGGAKDLAAIQRNNELAKSLTMFYSYFSVLYNRMRDMGRDVQEIRDMPRFLARVFFTVMVPAILGELILGRGPDDDEDPAAWAIRKMLLYPMMSVPVLRDVVSSIDSGFDYRFSPMATVFDKVGKAATATGKLFTDDIEWGDYSLKVAETIGYVFGVAGTAQISATGKYLWRVSEGEEQPDNLAELLAYAMLGKRKED